MKPVVITAAGLVSPWGESLPAVWDAVRDGRSAAAPAFTVPGRGPVAVAACRDFKAARHSRGNQFRRLMSRESSLAVAAMGHALADGALRLDEGEHPWPVDCYGATGATGLDFERIVRMVNHSVGPDGRFSDQRFCTEGLKKIHPLLSFQILPNMPPCFASIVHQVRGDALIFNPWEGNGGQAMAEGWQRIRNEGGRMALVGASDVKTHRQSWLFLHQIGLLRGQGEVWGRPFDEASVGPVAAEGAAWLLLESREGALDRGRDASIALDAAVTFADPEAGWGLSTSAEPLRAAMARALEGAGLEGGEIDLVLASADGSPAGDRAEADAIASLCPVASIVAPKAALGNAFAAAGPLAMACALEALRRKEATRVLVNVFGNGSARACFVLQRREA